MMKGMTKQTPSGISYAGKVVLVTGGASGIGRATALAFGRAGACVVIADTSVDGGHMTAALIVEAGGKALFVKANVTVAADVEALIDKAVGHYGRIDCAVNGAAVDRRVGDDDTGARAPECQRRRAADAAGTSGYQHNLACIRNAARCLLGHALHHASFSIA
jgi:NAD(P)-dependent dehydrogenase (short-subunit alcohol dehydrogenase family)